MKRQLKALAALPVRATPRPIRRRLVQIALHAIAGGRPRQAMRDLLEIETDLSGLIDTVALRYDNGVHVKHRLMRYHEFFVSRVRPGERVLDVGCGYGAVAHSIATRAGAKVTGIDLDAANVAQARGRCADAGITFLHGTAPHDVPREPFDAIVASNVLEHVDRRCEFLRDIQERTGAARWLIRVPMIDRDWRVPMRREVGLPHFSDVTHCVEYTRESFEAEMANAGFAVRHLQVNWGEIWAEVSSHA
jgi:SAM-dependent methyltransferase